MSNMAALGLGRVFNVVHDASGNMLNLSGCNAVTFVSKSSGSNTLTVVGAKTFGGSTTAWQPSNGFGQTTFYHETTAAAGTAAWTKVTSSWTNNVLTLGTSGKVDAVTIFCTQAADLFKYIQGTAAAGSLVAIMHDLPVQRAAANLAIVSA